jgi:hypothetical protein
VDSSFRFDGVCTGSFVARAILPARSSTCHPAWYARASSPAKSSNRVGVVFSSVRPSRGLTWPSLKARHRDVEAGEVLGQARVHECPGHVDVGELDVREIWFAEALSENARGLNVFEVGVQDLRSARRVCVSFVFGGSLRSSELGKEASSEPW